MNKWLVILLIFSVTVNLAVVGSLFYLRQHAPGPRHWLQEPPRNGMPRWAPFLKGDSVTRAENWHKIRQMRNSYLKDLEQFRRQADSARAQLKDRMLKETTVTDSVDVLIEKIAKLQADMERLTIAHLYEIRPLIRAENWEQLVRMRELKPGAQPHGPPGSKIRKRFMESEPIPFR